MARLWYRMSAAEFVIGLGESQPFLDESDDPVDSLTGRVALVAEQSHDFDVYTAPDSGSQTTDLLDADDQAITQISSSAVFESLGRIFDFQGPDGHVGPLFIEGGGGFFKIEPDSGSLWALAADNAAALTDLSTDDLTDWDNTDRADGRFAQWDNSDGKVVWAEGTEGDHGHDADDVGAVPVEFGVWVVEFNTVGGVWPDRPTTDARVLWIKRNSDDPNPEVGGTGMQSGHDLALLAQAEA